MKFPLAQEVSRHVRDKVCKFYKTHQSPTCTVTSDASKAFSLMTSDSIKFQSLANDKVPESLVADLIDNNFTDILSPTSFPLMSGSESEVNEFGMIIDELQAEQVVEVSFTCKLCDFR